MADADDRYLGEKPTRADVDWLLRLAGAAQSATPAEVLTASPHGEGRVNLDRHLAYAPQVGKLIEALALWTREDYDAHVAKAVIGDPARTSTATLHDIAHVAAWLARNEHWNQGSWDRYLRDGSVYRLVARIGELRDKHLESSTRLTSAAGCDRIITAAAEQAGQLLATGFGTDEIRPEDRFRGSMVAALGVTDPDLETELEYPPDLPHWPRTSPPPRGLGGFDLAIGTNDRSERPLLTELKWSTDRNLFWHALWDAVKLGHASQLPFVTATYLLTGAEQRSWQRNLDGLELYQNASIQTSDLIRRLPGRWRDTLADSSKDQPQKFPEYLVTRIAGEVSVTLPYGEWSIRVVRVEASGGWVDATNGWPVGVTPR